MTKFQEIADTLRNSGEKEVIITINGEKRKIKAAAEYSTINMEGDTYIKAVFEDEAVMFIIMKDEEVYFTEVYIVDTKIPDSDLGKEKLEFNGKIYKLINGDDYQYTIHLIKGTILDIEGEVRFYDYMPESEDEVLSLGWIVRTGERADVNQKMITLDNIEIEIL
jgi:hypothetical protein